MHLSFSILLSIFLAASVTALAMPAAKEGIEARKNACNFRLCEDCYLRCKAKEWYVVLRMFLLLPVFGSFGRDEDVLLLNESWRRTA